MEAQRAAQLQAANALRQPGVAGVTASSSIISQPTSNVPSNVASPQVTSLPGSSAKPMFGQAAAAPATQTKAPFNFGQASAGFKPPGTSTPSVVPSQPAQQSFMFKTPTVGKPEPGQTKASPVRPFTFTKSFTTRIGI